MRSMSVMTIKFMLVFLLAINYTSGEAQARHHAKITNKVKKLVNGNSNAELKVKQFVINSLLKQMINPVFVKAVKDQNSRGISMAAINKIDEEWKAAEDFLEIHDKMTTGKCADEVRRLAGKYNAIGETFVMDNQGANVCQNELTGDYWQGDEAKWKNSFARGAGGLDIGVEKLDTSTNLVLQQISLPIIDEKGKVIGAICFGIKTSKL